MRSFEASLNDSTVSFWANTVEITAKSMKKDKNIFRIIVVLRALEISPAQGGISPPPEVCEYLLIYNHRCSYRLTEFYRELRCHRLKSVNNSVT